MSKQIHSVLHKFLLKIINNVVLKVHKMLFLAQMEDVYLVLINANHYSHAKRTNIDALMEAAEA